MGDMAQGALDGVATEFQKGTTLKALLTAVYASLDNVWYIICSTKSLMMTVQKKSFEIYEQFILYVKAKQCQFWFYIGKSVNSGQT